MNFRVVLAFAVFCFHSNIFQCAMAQDNYDIEKKGAYGSIKVMYNLGWSSYKYSNAEKGKTNGRSGYGLGYDQILAFNENVFLSVGADFISTGYVQSSSSGSSKVKSFYINAPISLNYITDDGEFFSYHDKFLIGMGAYGAMAIGGQQNGITGTWEKLHFGNGTTDDFTKTDYGLLFNIGYKTSGLPFLVFSYGAGMKNVLSEKNLGDFDYRKLRSFKIYFFIPFN